MVVLQRSSVGLTTIAVHFTSNNCDEEPRSITEGKVYNLTWEGQIVPNLCHFQFTSGEIRTKKHKNPYKKYEVCFESAVFNLQNSSLMGVELKIQNYTGRAWNFYDNDASVPRTCVERAYKMSVSIQVPPGYVEPKPSTYIQIQITAVVVTDPDPDECMLYIIEAICITVAVFLTVAIFCKKFKNSNSRVGRCARGTLVFFGKIFPCLRERNS